MVQAYSRQLLNQKEWGNDAQMDTDVEPPLVLATRRLVRALDRLEGTLGNGGSGRGEQQEQQQQLAFFEKENDALKREHDNLNAAISQLKFQYDDLHQVASVIYGKLDDSIKRLTQIIEQ
ncbi:MAG: hypothetical protein KGI29_05455 [Pseudomonadota bacterium]|nr:hypothetical protein [Pseudomonadota bacterium]